MRSRLWLLACALVLVAGILVPPEAAGSAVPTEAAAAGASSSSDVDGSAFLLVAGVSTASGPAASVKLPRASQPTFAAARLTGATALPHAGRQHALQRSTVSHCLPLRC